MGGGEVPQPLQIPWHEMLRDGDRPVPEVIVTPFTTSDAGHAREVEDVCVCENRSDRDLRDAILRCRANVSDPLLLSRLPHKGKKFRNRLRLLEEEFNKRDDGARRGDRLGTESQKAVSPGLQNHQPTSSSSHGEPSFGSLFNKKLIDNKNTSSSTAFSEEIESLNRNKKKKSRWNLRVLLKSSSFGCSSSSMGKGSKQISSTGDCAIFKGKGSHGYASRLQNSSKDKEVVLLDEEDAQPMMQTQIMSGELEDTKIYYPSRDHPECVEICSLDLKSLDPESYLSSTIMNFYIQYLQNLESIITRSRGEYHFFNTYFYKKLEDAASSKVERNASFSKLRRWLKGVNIFQKSYLFLPIHGNLHWSLVIICIPAFDEECGPVILHLDSLGLHNSTVIFENIRRYLEEEWNHICQGSLEFPISEKTIMVPQQKNAYDCGLFVLYFMERFIEEAPERLRMKDLDMFGKKWFRSEEASALRKRIRDLLIKEFQARLENNVGSEMSLPSASSIGDGVCPMDTS